MTKRKRFQKQDLNSDDYKGMEQGAKALKACTGAVGVFVLLYANKDKLRPLGKVATNLARRIIR